MTPCILPGRFYLKKYTFIFHSLVHFLRRTFVPPSYKDGFAFKDIHYCWITASASLINSWGCLPSSLFQLSVAKTSENMVEKGTSFSTWERTPCALFDVILWDVEFFSKDWKVETCINSAKRSKTSTLRRKKYIQPFVQSCASLCYGSQGWEYEGALTVYKVPKWACIKVITHYYPAAWSEAEPCAKQIKINKTIPVELVLNTLTNDV